jgi:tetratricopeptide (TPR) repeat protein
VQLNPDNADAHFYLAVLLGPRNQLDEAIAHLRRVIEINPRNADTNRNLAVGLGLQGKLQEAIRHDQTASAFSPTRPRLGSN